MASAQQHRFLPRGRLAATLLAAALSWGCGDDLAGTAPAHQPADASGEAVIDAASEPATDVSTESPVDAKGEDSAVTPADDAYEAAVQVDASEDGHDSAAPYDFVDDAAVNTATLAPGWTCEAFKYQSDVWVRTYNASVGAFDFRIGAAGVVAEMRNVQASYGPMLSPSFNGESTDRVIQWTAWCDSIQIPGVSYDPRYNLTQAGTFDNVLSPTIEVQLRNNGDSCEIDVWAVPQDQWNPQVRAHVTGRMSALTRYRVFGQGEVLVRRLLRVGATTVDGLPRALTPLYLEAWSPFLVPLFNALAVSVDGAGQPLWWYQAGQTIPQYPGFPVETTPGYAVVYQTPGSASHPAVGLVFGPKQPCAWDKGACVPTGKYVLNSMDWNNGIGVLPGITLTGLEVGSVIDQYLILVPGLGLDAALAARLQAAVPLVPAPRIFAPSAVVAPPLSDWINRLAAQEQASGVRTDHLSALVTP